MGTCSLVLPWCFLPLPQWLVTAEACTGLPGSNIALLEQEAVFNGGFKIPHKGFTDTFYLWMIPKTLCGLWCSPMPCTFTIAIFTSYKPDMSFSHQAGAHKGILLICVTADLSIQQNAYYMCIRGWCEHNGLGLPAIGRWIWDHKANIFPFEWGYFCDSSEILAMLFTLKGADGGQVIWAKRTIFWLLYL